MSNFISQNPHLKTARYMHSCYFHSFSVLHCVVSILWVPLVAEAQHKIGSIVKNRAPTSNLCQCVCILQIKSVQLFISAVSNVSGEFSKPCFGFYPRDA